MMWAEGNVSHIMSSASGIVTAANDLLLARGEKADANGSGNEADLLAVCDRIYKIRRRREAIFGKELGLFGEPGWDILLDLFSAHLKGVNVPINSACVAACVPSTTALRWLNSLEEQGLVERERDAHDLRRSYVRLTSEAIEKLAILLSNMA